MAASTPLLAHIHRLFAPSAVDLGSDAELLQRFVSKGDEAAFAVLAARHGPMVLRLCRRVLGDVHTAEDACQAAFLVLARKADHIRHPETLSSWLHGVAYRLALKARAAEVRRRQIETQHLHSEPPPSPSDPLAEVSARELLAILDAELQRLPEKYRLPLILCCLEGRSQPEAARLLGWTPGSVKGRLERGRAKLHQRLLRRGLTLPSVLLALEAARDAASARLPALLSAAILRAASTPTTAGGISTAVLALAEGSLSGMASVKVKIASVLVLMLGLAAGGFSALVYPQLAAPPPNEQQKAEPMPTAKQRRQPRTDHYGDPLPPGALARLGTIRWRLPHFGADRLVTAADGKTLVTVHPQGGISIWDSATGKIVRQIPSDQESRPDWLSQKRQWGSRAPGAAQRSTALSADGRSAAFATANGDIYIVDIPTGKVRQCCRGHQGIVQETVLSADGEVLVSRSEDGTLRIWDVSSGREVRQLSLAKQEWVQHQPLHLALSANGKTAAWVGTEKERPIHVYDISSSKEKHRLLEHPGEERGIAFSPRGDLLLATCGKGPDQLWDVQTGRLVRTLPHKPVHYASAAAFTADGSRLALAIMGGGQRLYEVSTGKEIWRIASSWGSTEPELLAFAPDGKTLYHKTPKIPGWVLHRYDTRSGAPLAAPEESRGNFDAIAFAPGDRILHTVGGLWMDKGDSRMWMWNAQTGAALRQTATRYGGCLFSPDGRFLVFLDQEDTVHLCELATEKELWRQRTSAGRHLSAWAFSLDGTSLAIAERGDDAKTGHRIVVRSTANGAERGQLRDLDQPAEDLLIAPDYRSLAYVVRIASSRSQECSIHFRDLATGRRLRQPTRWFSTVPLALAFSPDGRTAAVPAEHRHGYISIDLQECAAGWRTRLELPPLESIPSPVAFSPDGLLFVVGDPDGAVRIFDAHSGRLLRRQEGHCTGVKRLVFSHDGRKLATTSYDTTALIWDITDLLHSARGKEVELSEAELLSLWGDLAAVDAARAYRAIGRLAQGGKPILPWLRKRLLPMPPVDPKRLAQLVADLDDDRFTVREKATAELTELGELAVPALRKALEGRPSLELRRRAESLLKQAEDLSDYKSRILRSVEVVESIGGTDAETLLKEWAKRAAEASLSREAKASLERLTRQHHPKP